MYHILDTNVLLSGLLFKGGKEEKVIDYCFTNGIICFSEETMQELLEVSVRSKFDKYLDREIRTLFTTKILADALIVTPTMRHALCRDPKNDKFLDVAHVSEASYLVTGDQDLLVLKKFGKTRIVTAADFMKIHSEK